MRFLDKIAHGLTAFATKYVTSKPIESEDWNSFAARGIRYDVLWSAFDSTNYQEVHNWANAYRTQYGLYKYVRPIYSPATRLGNFWRTHLFGGDLDIEAGPTGAIPIETDNEAVRAAIAELWKWSRWQSRKDILSVRGTILGDIAIQVVDDVSRGRVYLDLVHPGKLYDVSKDPFGNVKAYILSEEVPDPLKVRPTATYTEKVYREGVNVIYETYRNEELFAWPKNVDRTGNAVSRWSEPYGFIPLIVIQHNDVGLDWGWSELHPLRAKMQEADDIASMLGDQIRKSVNPIWLMRGMKETSLSLEDTDRSTDNPFPGREAVKAIWGGNKDTTAEAMVANLDFESVLLHIDSLLKEMERDIPELSTDINNAGGDASGRALRIARQPVVAKVMQRRSNYDAGLVAAQQMAISIGGFRGYPEYSGFNLESYIKGDLDHNIMDRPVFEQDSMDEIEISTAQWAAAKAAMDVGIPLESYLKNIGWDELRIAELNITEPEVEETMEVEDAQAG